LGPWLMPDSPAPGVSPASGQAPTDAIGRACRAGPGRSPQAQTGHRPGSARSGACMVQAVASGGNVLVRADQPDLVALRNGLGRPGLNPFSEDSHLSLLIRFRRKGIVRSARAAVAKRNLDGFRSWPASICSRLNPYSQPIPAPDPWSATISLPAASARATRQPGSRSGGRDPGRWAAAADLEHPAGRACLGKKRPAFGGCLGAIGRLSAGGTSPGGFNAPKTV